MHTAQTTLNSCIVSHACIELIKSRCQMPSPLPQQRLMKVSSQLTNVSEAEEKVCGISYPHSFSYIIASSQSLSSTYSPLLSLRQRSMLLKRNFKEATLPSSCSHILSHHTHQCFQPGMSKLIL